MTTGNRQIIHVLHLSVWDALGTVFPAQVVKPMTLLHEYGWHPHLLSMVPMGQFLRPSVRVAWRQRIEEVAAVSPLILTRLISPPSRLRGLWPDYLILLVWIARHFGRDCTGLVVHCRGCEAARLAQLVRRHIPGLRVLLDCRGLNGRELAYEFGYETLEDVPGQLGERLRKVERAEQDTATRADWIICVSEEMRKFVCGRWKVPSSKTTVVPCCTDTGAAQRMSGARDVVRKKLQLSNKFVAVYCGSLSPWQVPGQWLDWFKRLATLQHNAHLLVVTSNPARMEFLADAAGIPARSRTLLCAPQARVAEYLAAADCGLLVREPNVINEVASPVKFAEYLAAGVPVLISEGVGDYSSAVRAHRLGAVLPKDPRSLEARRILTDFLAERRENGGLEIADRCKRFAREHLDWPAKINLIQAVYEHLTHDNSFGSGDGRSTV